MIGDRTEAEGGGVGGNSQGHRHRQTQRIPKVSPVAVMAGTGFAGRGPPGLRLVTSLLTERLVMSQVRVLPSLFVLPPMP